MKLECMLPIKESPVAISAYIYISDNEGIYSYA